MNPTKKKKKQNVRELLLELPERIAIAIARRDSPLADLAEQETIAEEIFTTPKTLEADRSDHRWGIPYIKMKGKIVYSREAVHSHLQKFQIDPTAARPRRRNRKGE